MSRYRLPGAATIPVLPTDGRVKVLAHLFEPCDALNTLALEYLATGPFDNYDEVITLIKQLLIDLKDTDSPSNTAWLLKILAAHPRLGEKRIDSEHSRLEQASLTAESEEEGIKLKALNKQYEETFPGLRYVVFVNGRSRAVIMEDMERRIARGDIEVEKTEAINAMCDIARDRVDKLLPS
ncbi:hypothetical protein P167DRAFT_562796 [Morchella conica CCBAS932]|uniref:Oxo-4-hydroxy-4-carboxy-5-ureidoimidazoline decarboxylase domain-containing protein n=2 Tax=Morchella sect. Distantes TaxID=1051054 RepID=A0A3N4L384_9PEZI|nr:hypothetical protein P167DRAFT_562796 [Morchella conica CCBAS932]